MTLNQQTINPQILSDNNLCNRIEIHLKIKVK